MDHFPLEELVEKAGSRFAVVVAAAKRAKQIKDGSPPLVETTAKNPLTIALAEIAAGKVLIQPVAAAQEDEVVGTFEQYFAGREAVQDEPLPYRRQPREVRLRDDLDEDEEEDEEDDLEDEEDELEDEDE